MPAPDPEFLLLRRSACALLGGVGARELTGSEAIDWHRLLWLGRRQGALLLLHRSLCENPAAHAQCPAEIYIQLDELSAAARLQSLVRTAEICRLYDLFARHDIPIAVTDDWMFQQVFGSARPLVESVAEIRCAISPPFEDRARQLLCEAGYPDARAQFQIAASGCTPVRIENGFDLPGLWAGKNLVRIGNRPLHAPDPLQWLWLFAVRHQSRAPTLFQSWQVALLVRHLGQAWPSLIVQAAAAGLEPTLRHLVTASHDLLELPLPFTAKIDLASSPPMTSNVRPREMELPISPFLPTPPIVAERMLALASVGPDDVVCDLGCGDGQLVIAAATKFGARGLGIERDPLLVAAATAQAQAEGVGDKVTFVCGDLFSADLRNVSVICFYLLPALCEPILRQVLPRAQPGTRIVSHDYSFRDWSPEKTELVRTAPARIAQIYLWRLPGSASGIPTTSQCSSP